MRNFTYGPCEGRFVGRIVTEFCDECGHSLTVHLENRTCELCLGVLYCDPYDRPVHIDDKGRIWIDVTDLDLEELLEFIKERENG
jgi:hypothetical protein